VGDRVRIADTTGDVLERTLLVTRVRTIHHEDITIPNAMVLGSHIVNFSSSVRDAGLILHTSVTIGYDAPWRKVHELLLGAAAATEGIVREPKAYVLQTSLDDSYVSYQLNAFTDRPNDIHLTYARLHENIQDQFNAGGVEIMSPHYAALRDGNKVTIPEGHLAADNRAQAFRVQTFHGATDGGSEPGRIR
jgi:small-conductance mechanosensitive channel